MKYAVLITMHDGAQECYGPFSASRVELVRERAESLGWVERASVITCYSHSAWCADWREANRRAPKVDDARRDKETDNAPTMEES